MRFGLPVQVPAVVVAPADRPAGDPEVASATGELANRWRDARASEPVEADTPTRFSVRRQVQLNFLAASSGAAQTGPFVSGAIAHEHQQASG